MAVGDAGQLLLTETGGAVDQGQGMDCDIETMEEKFVAVNTKKKCYHGFRNCNLYFGKMKPLWTIHWVCMYITKSTYGAPTHNNGCLHIHQVN